MSIKYEIRKHGSDHFDVVTGDYVEAKTDGWIRVLRFDENGDEICTAFVPQREGFYVVEHIAVAPAPDDSRTGTTP